MKDYLLMLMAFGGFFMIFYGIEFCEDLMQMQIFASIGVAMFGLSVPVYLELDMYEEKKKKEKEEK